MAPKRPFVRLRALLALAVGVGLLASPLAAVAPAQAAAVTGFNAGNIIADSIFYDGNAMSAAQVQAFLNSRVTRCTIGDPGREAGKVWGSTKIASRCLKDSTATTPTREANAFCAGYAGAKNETAAQMIAKVGKACGINPRVLLVMLEKEQSLVTDTWPTVRQYAVAMGYACPDSGPNNSANCDPSQTGFFQQLYRAAWQLKVYKANPRDYNYLPGATNRIQWHPNAGCGTSQVYIQNSATAALYIYTPYRPNQAALDAGWGEGDACSSYGNRNFYNFYTTWFGQGSTQTPYPVDGKILAYWQANNAWLGAPTAAAVSNAAGGGGRTQQFAGGTVFEPKAATTASGMTKTSPLLAAFTKAGGIGGSWGWPIAAAVNQGSSGNTTMRFQGGTASEAKGVGVFLVPEKLRGLWESKAIGGFTGAVGYPTAAAKTTASGAIAQDFKGGTLVQSSAGGALRVDPNFLAAWRALGGATSSLGVPVAAPVSVPENGGGQTYALQGGTLYRSKAGVFSIGNGAYRDAYRAAGGERGSYGWPTGAAFCGLPSGGCAMPFQNGVGVWSAKTGMTKLTPAAYAAWKPVAATLGYPKGVATPVGSGAAVGSVQPFDNGDLYASNAGAFPLAKGPIRDGYLAAGGPMKAWGWPRGTQNCAADGSKCTMSFIGGTATWTRAGGLSFTASPQNLPKERLSGADRFETAVAVSKHGYPGTAGTVIVANGLDYPDALSAGALGAKWEAPLLLTRPGALPEAPRAEITRLKPGRIVVVGGPGAVSDGVLSDLKRLSARVDRVSGIDRYATSIAISRAGWPDGTSGEAFVATGADFADALSAGAAAGRLGAPVLLVPGAAKAAPAPVSAELNRLGAARVRIAGGTGAVSSGIQSSLAGGRTIDRYAGADRYDTSARIANGVFPSGASVPTYWANGQGFADALAGGAVAGAQGSPLLLSRPSCVPRGIAAANDRVVGGGTYLLGGSGALSDAVLAGRTCAV